MSFHQLRRCSRARVSSNPRAALPRHRRLLLETLESRTLLSVAPLLVGLQPGSDSGFYGDDNLTNVRSPILDITAAQAGDMIQVYRAGNLLGQATQVADTLYRYTVPGQLTEGTNSITARSFDGSDESPDSSPLMIVLDTAGPAIIASTPATPVNLRTSTLDHVTVTFSEPIDFASSGGGSFTTDDVSVNGPDPTSKIWPVDMGLGTICGNPEH